MQTTQAEELLHQLRAGTLDVVDAQHFGTISPDLFLLELTKSYPILFQERSIKQKHEVGVARSRKFEITAHKRADSPLLNFQMLPILRRCVFVSWYEGSISEVTAMGSIHLKPKKGHPHEVILTTSRGFKLDRTPDGWEIKALHKRAVALSGDFLLKRGWKFDALAPFMSQTP